MRPKIVVVGSANVDFIMQVPHLPAVGETVTDCAFMQTFGGKGANQAVAAARAGGEVAFVAALGNDPYTPMMLEGFASSGVSTEWVAQETDIASGSALVMFDENGANYLAVAPGSNYRVTPQRVLAAEAVIAAADWVVMQMEIPTDSIVAALEIAEKHGRPVMFNYAPVRDLSVPMTSAVHALVVNENEAAELIGNAFDPTDIAEAARVAEQLRQQGKHRFTVVTLGSAGAVVATDDGTTHTPAFEVKSVDTTAAGDTFCGALATALGQGREMADAIRFASAAAALCCTGAGAQPSIPDSAAIENFLVKKS